jgi:hypothetical protein
MMTVQASSEGNSERCFMVVLLKVSEIVRGDASR